MTQAAPKSDAEIAPGEAASGVAVGIAVGAVPISCASASTPRPIAARIPAQGKLHFVDALRGMAIFGVLVVHVTTTIHGVPSWLWTMGREGARGVQLFYVISAFTLFLSMSRRTKRERRPTLNFFIRRFARIAPLFYSAVILYLLIYGLSYQDWRSTPTITTGTIVSTLTFTNAWHPYWITAMVPGGWSVAIEMCFYLTVPLLFLLIKSWRSATVFVIVSLALGMILTRHFEHHPPMEFGGRSGHHQVSLPERGKTADTSSVHSAAPATAMPAQHSANHASSGTSSGTSSRAAASRSLAIPATAAAPRRHSGAESAAAAIQPLSRSSSITTQPGAVQRRLFSSPARSARGPESFKPIDAWKAFMLFWLPNQLPVFGMGILLFFIYLKYAGQEHNVLAVDQSAAATMQRRGRYAHRRLGHSLVLIAIELLILKIWFLPASVGDWLPDMLFYGAVFVVLAIGLAMYKDPVLVNRFWIYLGKISYSAYLLHWSVLRLLEKTLGPPLQRMAAKQSRSAGLLRVQHRLGAWVNYLPTMLRWVILLALLLAITMVIATVTYRLIEQPGQYLGKRLIRKLEQHAGGKPIAVPAPNEGAL